MARLTQAEARLIQYPPNPDTWACGATLKTPDGDPFSCGGRMAGRFTSCVFCGKKKPRNPKLIWPEYVRACAKAGIEPTDRKQAANE